MEAAGTHDVVHIADVLDLRLPGPTSRKVAAELENRHAAGWRSGLVHVNGPHVASVRPIRPELRRQIEEQHAQLLALSDSVTAVVTVVWHPVLLQNPDTLPPLRTQCLLIMGAQPIREDGSRVYNPARVHETALALFGVPPRWIAPDPRTRDTLRHELPPQAEITTLGGGSAESEGDTSRFTSVVQRVGDLLPAPAPTPCASDTGSIDHPRVLLISSNGAGMGHLTRLLAYARRMGGASVHFLSLSQAVGVVAQFGYTYEYLPSTGATGLSNRDWGPLFRERLRNTLERFDPDVVVFDGTWPYNGIKPVRKRLQRARWIWSRRGMWKPQPADKAGQHIARSDWFDHVLEPSDFASPRDAGATTSQQVHRVHPVTLLDPGDLVDAGSARRALGLPESGPTALLSLGAGNINDIHSDVGGAVEALRKLDVNICITQSQIGSETRVPSGVLVVRHFPLSKYFNAFDVAISAAGYNSFHELLRFKVPTLFLPNAATALDDQVTRAGYAAELGAAHVVADLSSQQISLMVEDLLENRKEFRQRMAAMDAGNGAQSAADFIMEATPKASAARRHEA